MSDGNQQQREGVFEEGLLEGYTTEEENVPLASYATLGGAFASIFALFALLAPRAGRPLPERVEAKDMALIGVATHKLSTMVANDAVTSPLRAPFTELQEKQSPKSLDQQPRGQGIRRALGELLTCKFCLGTWMAASFTYGLVLAPRVTRLFATIFSVVAIADYLHQAYKALMNRA